MSQVLYRKWRPRRWEQVAGQDHVVQTLRNAVTAQRVAHAHLFAGPRGTGKTTTARLLAKAVNCLEADLGLRPCDRCAHCEAVNQGRFLDLIEIDAASNTSVDDVRDLREKINFSPNQGRYKVYIIDEVHMLSTAAFNALLKTLEEPPAHAIFVLATTEVHKIPATVLSRCQRHEFRRIPVTEIVAYLKQITASEDILVDEDALTLVCRQSTGSMRDAISLLDQLASAGERVTLEMAQAVLGTATSQVVLELVEALVAGKAAEGLECIHRALDAGSDPRQFARQIVECLRGLLLVKAGSGAQVDVTPEIRQQMGRHADVWSVAELLRLIQVFNQAAGEARAAWQPALPLELAFLELLETPSPPQGELPLEPKRVLPRRQAQSGASPQAPPPAEQPPGADPAGVAPDARDPLFQRVLENWRQIVSLVAQHSRQTQALLNSCRPFGVNDGVLFLSFNGDFAKTKMEKGDHIELAQKALAQVLQSELVIRCFVSRGAQGAPPAEVESDGMVASALRDLGGEIVDVQ